MSGRIFLEDYNIQFHHIKEQTNTLTDARSVSPFNERQNTLETSKAVAPNSNFFQFLQFLFFSMLRSTDTNISSRGSKQSSP
jgi:hypothetical protein